MAGGSWYRFEGRIYTLGIGMPMPLFQSSTNASGAGRCCGKPFIGYYQIGDSVLVN